MRKLKKVAKYLIDPCYRFEVNRAWGLYDNMSDEEYLRKAYKRHIGKTLHLNNPLTYNEKIQWLKLYDRKPEYTVMVDKYAVKEYIANLIGSEYVIPTLGCWDSPEEIDFDSLPDSFVLKCTHDSGGVIIIKDKKCMDQEAIIKELKKHSENDYYKGYREWPYKNVPHRIIAEKYMEDSRTKELRDYKFFCFNGCVKALFIATDRQNQLVDTKFDFFDESFRHLPITNGHPNADVEPEKPVNFKLMIGLAESISKNIPHVRVDLYEINGKVYFGEMTFYHWSGLVPFEPEEWDRIFGEWIELPSK